MLSLEQWQKSGERVRVGGHELFCRVSGEGPWLTFLHGFPTATQGVGHWNRTGHRVAGEIIAAQFCGAAQKTKRSPASG